MYARVFETSSSAKGKVPELTEEGQVLIARANIKVADLMPKTLDDFVKLEMQTDTASVSPRGKAAKGVTKPEPAIFMGTTLNGSAKKGLNTTRFQSESRKESLTENVTADDAKSRKT